MTHSRTIKRIWILTAVVVLVQILIVQAMAASGALHKRCHDHAGEDGHECVVTLMLSGGYDTVSPKVVPVGCEPEPPPMPVATPKSADSAPSHLCGGVLAHAPPRGP